MKISFEGGFNFDRVILGVCVIALRDNRSLNKSCEDTVPTGLGLEHLGRFHTWTRKDTFPSAKVACTSWPV